MTVMKFKVFASSHLACVFRLHMPSVHLQTSSRLGHLIPKPLKGTKGTSMSLLPPRPVNPYENIKVGDDVFVLMFQLVLYSEYPVPSSVFTFCMTRL